MLEAGHEDVRGQAGVPFVRADPDLRRRRPAVARLSPPTCRRSSGVKKGDRIAVMMPNLLGFPGRLPGHHPRRARCRSTSTRSIRRASSSTSSRMPASRSWWCSAASSATVAEVMAATPRQDRHHGRPRRWQRRAKLPSPPVDPRLTGAICICRCRWPKAPSSTFDPGRSERRRSSVPAIHRRHDRAVQGRVRCRTATWSPTPSSSRRCMPAALRRRRGCGRHRDSALSHLCVDGESHQLLLVGAGELAGGQSARHGRVDRHLQASRGPHRVHRREHAVYRGWPRIPGSRKWTSRTCACLIGGGAAVIPATSARWKEVTGRLILEGYGLSETSPILPINPAVRQRVLRHHRAAAAVHGHQADRRSGQRGGPWASPAKSAPAGPR